MAVDFTKGFGQNLGADIFCDVNTSYSKKYKVLLLKLKL